MMDPLLGLALSLHHSRGVYALLIGSGVSRAAGIPTGWEIVLDLVRKVASMQGEVCEPDPVGWYVSKFGRQPDYAELLSALAKSSTERQRLLRSYFEPSEDERGQGLKQPTQAHRAIAELVAGGYVRVILTTNFDQLIERALQERGTNPTVLSTPDAIKGTLPLIHQNCTVIKINGDYLDHRIRNTAEELAAYDGEMQKLLSAVFDEFGMIVCGWSGRWDTALRREIEACPSRRFTWYWTSRGRLDNEAQKLVALRQSVVVPIEDADAFLRKLAELVIGLRDSRREHPISIEAAVAAQKRYLSEPRFRLNLDDFMADEAEALYLRIEEYERALLAQSVPEIEVWSRHYFELSERMIALLVNGCAFSTPDHQPIWLETLQRFARRKKPPAGGPVLADSMKLYPSLLLLYASGLAATARQKHEIQSQILTKLTGWTHRGVEPLLLAIDWHELHAWFKSIAKHNRHYVPLSEHLFEVLREPLRRFLPDESQYADTFDRFEYLRSLVFAHLSQKREEEAGRRRAPMGRFAWRFHGEPKASIIVALGAEAKESAENWAYLSLFDRSYARFKLVKTEFDAIVSKQNFS